MSGPCVPKTTADAVRQQAYAARNRAVASEQAPGDPNGARWALLEAVDMEAYAADFLELPPTPLKSGPAARWCQSAMMQPSGLISSKLSALHPIW